MVSKQRPFLTYVLAAAAACALAPVICGMAASTFVGLQAGRERNTRMLEVRAEQAADLTGEFCNRFATLAQRAAELAQTVALPNGTTDADSVSAAVSAAVGPMLRGEPAVLAAAVCPADLRLCKSVLANPAPLWSDWTPASIVAAARTAEPQAVVIVPVVRRDRGLAAAFVVRSPSVSVGFVGELVILADFAPTSLRLQQTAAAYGNVLQIHLFDDYLMRLPWAKGDAEPLRPLAALAPAVQTALTEHGRYGEATGTVVRSPPVSDAAAKILTANDLPRTFTLDSDSRGAGTTAVARRLLHPAWTIVVSLPADQSWLLGGQIILRGVLVSLAVIALALALATWATRRFAAPVAKIIAAANRLAAGEAPTDFDPPRTRELAELLDAFGRTAHRISQHRTLLESAVLAKTRQLQEALADQEAANCRLTEYAREREVRAAQLGQLQDELRRHADELEAAERNRTTFLRAFCQELRTAMNAVAGFSSILRRRAGTLTAAEQQQSADDIESGTRHLEVIINDVGDLADAQAGIIVSRKEAVYPVNVIGEAVEVERGYALAKGVTLQVLGATDLPVTGDRDRIRQILVNLIDNAIKYSPHGSSVQVCAEDVGAGAAEFWVRDWGPGIEPAAQSGVFLPFAAGSPEGSGSGAGLAVCSMLIKQMAGDIGVDSAPHVGSRFWFRLPRAAHATLPARNITVSGHFSQTLAGVPILVVSSSRRDDEGLADALAAIGSCVRWADSTVSALEAAIAQPPAVVIADADLPDGGGIQLFQALAADAELANVACILISKQELVQAAEPRARQAWQTVAASADVQQWVDAVERAAGVNSGDNVACAELASRPLVLVAEDNPLTSRLLGRMVSLAGARAAFASDGLDAVRLALHTRPDLMLFDLVMPKINGFEALARLRDHPDFRNTPAIAITALAASADEVRARQVGFADFLRKPVTSDALSAALAKLLPALANSRIDQERHEILNH